MSKTYFEFYNLEDAIDALNKCTAGLGEKAATIYSEGGKHRYEKPAEQDINCQSCSEEVKCTYKEVSSDNIILHAETN